VLVAVAVEAQQVVHLVVLAAAVQVLLQEPA
jgi:hypothetical protein